MVDRAVPHPFESVSVAPSDWPARHHRLRELWVPETDSGNSVHWSVIRRCGHFDRPDTQSRRGVVICAESIEATGSQRRPHDNPRGAARGRALRVAPGSAACRDSIETTGSCSELPCSGITMIACPSMRCTNPVFRAC